MSKLAEKIHLRVKVGILGTYCGKLNSGKFFYINCSKIKTILTVPTYSNSNHQIRPAGGQTLGGQ
jgi:hypothetical protein